MFIVLLNMVVVTVLIVIACFVTFFCLALITGSLIRHAVCRKKGKKTKLIGMWAGIVALLIPWVFVLICVINVKIYTAEYHYWDPSDIKPEVTEAIAEKDAEALYDLFADDLIDETGLTVEDVEEFLSQIDIENTSRADMERYAASSGEDGCDFRQTDSLLGISHTEARTEDQMFFQMFMRRINDEGDMIYIAGSCGDRRGEDGIGLYYVVFVDDSGEWHGIGRSQTWAHYRTPEVEEEASRLL